MIGSPVLTGVAHDLIDAMLHTSGGEVLAVTDGGESDYIRDGHVSAKSLRRLVAAGLISNVHGMQPDRLAAVCGFEGNASSFVEWWCQQGLSGLDARADRRDGVEWCERERPAESMIPAPVVAYLERLIHGPKVEYASLYVMAKVAGDVLPADPGTEWARKARVKVDKLIRL